MKRIINIIIVLFLATSLFSEPINQNVKNFSQLADLYEVKISPNGQMVGVLREIDDERMLSIIDLNTQQLIHNHRFIRKGQIGSFTWLNDQRLLMVKVNKYAGENRLFLSGELYAVNIDGKKALMLTGPQAKRSSDTVKDDPRQRAMVMNKLKDDPDNILIQFFTSNRFNQLYKLNIYDGTMERYVTPPVRSPYYAFDAKGNVMAVSGINPKTYTNEIYIYNKFINSDYFSGSACSNQKTDCVEVTESKESKIKNRDWTFWKTTDWDEDLRLVSYEKESNSLITIENDEDQDLSGIYRTNLRTGDRSLIYRHERVDIGWAHVDDDGKFYAASIMDGYSGLVYFKGKNERKELIKLLKNRFPGSTVYISAQTDDKTITSFEVNSDINPGIHYLHDSTNGQIRAMGKSYNSVDYSKLSYMDPISFEAKDGTTIYGYLTKSSIGNSKDSPTIVHPHGGPEAQDRWGYDGRVQMLSSEGFNVLQINFRGSIGYGKSYTRYIRGNWDGVLNDIFDGMEYLHAEGLIDQFNTCIYGGSYGGYAATQAAIMRPDLFKCSVSDVGVYDLVAMFKDGDIQASRGGQTQLEKRLGTDKDRLIEMSPHYNAEKLKVPFFMIHGKNDIRAPYEHAVAFSKKLNKLGFKHKTKFIGNEGHGYFDETIRYETNMELINFFKQHLN